MSANESEVPAPEPASGNLFDDIEAEQRPTEIESYCVNCGENGLTRLLLTRIPHFKEIVLMAFECPHCHFRNNEIQPASAVAEQGIHITCKIQNKTDLSRQVVKSESATIRFEELDFEIPPQSQRGVLTTVEGLLDRAIEGLSQDQPARLMANQELYTKVNNVITQLQDYMEGNIAFTISLDDPAGNSMVENPHAPKADPDMTLKKYKRTKEQIESLGLLSDEAPAEQALNTAFGHDEMPFNEQIHTFPGNCSRCNVPSETKMHILEIPHFKEVIIMATSCDACGYKSNDVKAGGAVSPKGRRITLTMTEQEDLSRDILKSETCGLSIPEIDLELTPGTLGGRFTTIEGLLSQVAEELEARAGFITGDSAQSESKNQFSTFLEKLRKVLTLEINPITLILDDPLANSHLQNLYAPDPDPNMIIEDYERTWDQNEGLGLNDMKVEGYEQDAS